MYSWGFNFREEDKFESSEMTNTTGSFNGSLNEDSTTMYIIADSAWAWIKITLH